MSKQLAIAMAVGGVVLLIGSVVILKYPDFSKWFPAFLIGGGVLLWMGVKNYLVAR